MPLLTDWLILTAPQLLYNYFMPRGLEIMYVYIFIELFLKKLLHTVTWYLILIYTQLYDLKQLFLFDNSRVFVDKYTVSSK